MTQRALCLLAALAIVAGIYAMAVTHGDRDGLGERFEGMHEYGAALRG